MEIQIYTSKKQTITIESQPFASGGEGSIHRIKDPKNYQDKCVKIYFEEYCTPEKEQKTLFQVENPPQNLSNSNFIVCWPIEMVYRAENQLLQFAGFIMPLAYPNCQQLYELCLPNIKQSLQNVLHQKFNRTTKEGMIARFKLCVNIAIAIHAIHSSKQYVLVDAKPQNISFTHNGQIAVTDIDSIQINDLFGNVIHHAAVATPEYIPSEGQNGILLPTTHFIPQSWDNFAIAVIFYELLLGLHPYAATFGGAYANQNTVSEKIQNGLFVHGNQKKRVSFVPPLHHNYQLLPTTLQSLFYDAFENGHNFPDKRPSAEVWGQTLFAELMPPQKNIKPQPLIVKHPPHPKQEPKPTVTPAPPSQPVTAKKQVSKQFLTIFLLAIFIGAGIFLINNYREKRKVQPTAAAEITVAEAAITAAEAAIEIDLNIVQVEGGTYTMGCPFSTCGSDEKPAHAVTLSTFRISKYEVTQAQWKAIMSMSATNSEPSYFKGCAQCPVENVSYDDIEEFIRKLNQHHSLSVGKGKYRLPTEAEWEYAARGGTESKGYQFAGGNDLDDVAWFGDNSNRSTHPVGKKKPNELGLYDMSGNVWEWCSDWYNSEYYAQSGGASNPLGSETGSSRVLRGGSWYSIAVCCRMAYRNNITPTLRNGYYGFRLVFVP